MYTEFNNLPSESRIWIYQCNRLLTTQEADEISKLTKSFLESWTAHKVDLNAGFLIPDNAFLVIAVDEAANGASGCSIDTKVHFIQSMESRFGVRFFDRMNIAFVNEEESISICTFGEFEKLLDNGEVTGDTLVFNNLVEDIHDFHNHWKIPLRDSWHTRLLHQHTL